LYSFITPYIQEHLLKDKNLAISLKFELDRRIYHYGDHFFKSYEADHSTQLSQLSLRLRNFFLMIKVLLNNKALHIPKNTIVTNCYVSINYSLQSKLHHLIRPPWDLSLKQNVFCSYASFKKLNKIKNILNSSSLATMLKPSTLNELSAAGLELEAFYSNPNIKGAIFPNDVGFFETQSIQILKKLNKPSFLLLHGIPGVYNNEMYNRSDYLLVWGEGLKNIFVQKGFSPEKIKVVGHPITGNFPKKLKSSLESILILGSSIPGSQHHHNKLVLRDRGNIIFYCYLIEKILKDFGIKQVRLRPHPSENKEWYLKYINKDFFILDNSFSVKEAITKSSLVIGPSSSSSMESLNAGVNYIVFEPFHTENNNSSYELVPPFDGSDPRLVVAKNENELISILNSNKLCDLAILPDFLGHEFCLDSELNKLI
jgi:hypothetical protein